MSSTSLARQHQGQDSLAAYLQHSRGPLASLIFIAPLLLLYEAGVLMLGHDAVRNGADVWLRHAIGGLGIGGYFLLPAVTAAALLAWQHTSRQSWQVPPRVLPLMGMECLLLAAGLVLLAQFQGAVVQSITGAAQKDWALNIDGADRSAQFVAYLGAGVYEETLFRLLLIPALIGVVQVYGGGRPLALASAALVSSLAFAAAHHLGACGESFTWYSFLFRTTAGGIFAGVFLYRGFGIAAGAHAAYDVLVGL